MLKTAYIGLGSNIGDGMQTLRWAWSAIDDNPNISIGELSSPYLSEPVGMESDNWFTNAVGRLRTDLEPAELLQVLLSIEADFGRRRDPATTGYQDRTLDLDIIYYADLVQDEKTLILPHPQAAKRLFVLAPLAELAPEFPDPADGQTPRQKLQLLYQQMQAGMLPEQHIKKSSWPED